MAQDNNEATNLQGKTRLADNGRALIGVFVSADANSIEAHAAGELVDYLTQVTGAPFTLEHLLDLPHKPAILVGRNAWTEDLIPELVGDALGEDGFVIRKIDEFVIIAGSHPRGTMYGVNHFLDHYVGIKWYSPRYTFVPSKSTLTLDITNDVQIPRFVYREIYVNDLDDEGYRAHNLLNGKFRDRYARVPQSEPHLNSWSDYWPQDVHNFHRIVPEIKYHSGGQLLAMNEDVRRIASKNLSGIIQQRIKQGKDASYGFSQEDTAWYPDAQSQAFANAHGGTLAAPIFDMVKDVAERVRAEIPEARIGTLAYRFTEKAPIGLTIPDNVVITFAPIDKDHGRAINALQNKETLKNAEQWAKISSEIVVWDYLIDFNGGGYLMPYPNLYAMAESIQWYAQYPAFKGYFGQHIHGSADAAGVGFSDLRTWLAARLLWNPDQDYRALIREFVQGYYGPAAPFINEYIELLHEEFEKTGSELQGIATPLGAPYLSFDLLIRADELFREAERAVAHDPVFSDHVQRARIEVDYVILMRGAEWKREAERRGIHWDTDGMDRHRRFVLSTIDLGNYKQSEPVYALLEVINIKRTVTPVPDFVKHVPEEDWIEFQTEAFNLIQAKLVHDPKASNAVAAKVTGSTGAWAFQLHNRVLPKEGRWKLYASVRVDPGEGYAASPALSYGIYPQSGASATVSFRDVRDGEYHFIEIPWVYEYNPAWPTHYVWFAPPSSTVIEYLYVDRVIAIRHE